jgi:hypothetical protein
MVGYIFGHRLTLAPFGHGQTFGDICFYLTLDTKYTLGALGNTSLWNGINLKKTY